MEKNFVSIIYWVFSYIIMIAAIVLFIMSMALSKVWLTLVAIIIAAIGIFINIGRE